MSNNTTNLEFKSYTYQSGATYEGQWLGSKRHGLGFWRHPEGETYEGQYAENKQNGLGVYHFGSSGKRFVGNWARGEMDGEGVYFFTPDQSSYYCGTYSQDKKNGSGFYMYDTGMLTVQTWKMGELTAEREATPAERVECAAMLRDLVMRVRRVAPKTLGALPEPQSSRLFQFPSGATYTGQYHGQKKQGVGLWIHPEGDCYEGCFDDNLHSGWGVYTSGRSGKKYVGQWLRGLMHGWGVYFFTPQETEYFIGTYVEDKKHGVGMYHYAESGMNKLQQWKAGELLSEADLDQTQALQWVTAIKKIVDYVLPYAPRYQHKCPATKQLQQQQQQQNSTQQQQRTADQQ
jgi:hypothetical protein